MTNDEEDSMSELYQRDRKSTRLNSSHLVISYAVFCLKKKKNTDQLILHYRDSVDLMTELRRIQVVCLCLDLDDGHYRTLCVLIRNGLLFRHYSGHVIN